MDFRGLPSRVRRPLDQVTAGAHDEAAPAGRPVHGAPDIHVRRSARPRFGYSGSAGLASGGQTPGVSTPRA